MQNNCQYRIKINQMNSFVKTYRNCYAKALYEEGRYIAYAVFAEAKTVTGASLA